MSRIRSKTIVSGFVSAALGVLLMVALALAQGPAPKKAEPKQPESKAAPAADKKAAAE